jgi:hypothetical protein
MNEEIIEEFNEKFNGVEDALKYIAESQAKSEFIRKRDQAQFRKDIDEIKESQARTQLQIEQTQKHLNHITKILRFTVEDLEFQEDKLEKAGNALSRKREK